MAAVLIVDDDDGIREILHFMLEDEHYTVLEAGDGIEALNILKQLTEPLVVMLDMAMPRMDGASVLRAVDADEHLRMNGYIIMSARRDLITEELRTITRRLTIPLIPKPFDMKHVLDTVAKVEQRLHSEQ